MPSSYHLETRIRHADKLLESAWGLIANSYGGNWEDASPEWKEAARRWRDLYHEEFSPYGDDDAAELPIG